MNNEANRSDPKIGLEVGERLFYTHLSTLTRGPAKGSYFEKRFGPDGSFASEYEYLDKHGRKVFSVDGDGELFAYILQYLRFGARPPMLGGFYENPKLWRALRLEADYFRLEGLVSSLEVVYSCSPASHGDKGVLYWLGTNKGMKEYQNPYHNDKVHVRVWADEDYQPPDDERLPMDSILAAKPESRAGWVQYRPTVEVKYRESQRLPSLDFELTQEWGGKCAGAFCEVACFPCSIFLLDLRSVTVRPTHYSLRYGGCYGMSANWNFEGSVDGESWDVLHAARDEDGLRRPSLKEIRLLKQNVHWMEDDQATRNDIFLSFLEQKYRRTWEVHSDDFYRYFRIIPPQPADPERGSCLHGVGLALFGDVHEN